MLSTINNITIQFKSQDFLCDYFEYDTKRKTSIFEFSTNRATNTYVCPKCGKAVEIYGNYTTVLKDMPIDFETRQEIHVHFNRYRCKCCGETFTENIDEIKYPGTRVTHRAAKWIKGLLRNNMTISAVNRLTGIHWETIKKIHMEIMTEALDIRKQELKNKDYKPKYLAVDEFAIHKGHRYATCVLDLIEGDVIWVGRGRAKRHFEKFFKEIDLEYLSEVKAIAMDMNASYNLLVSKYMPNVDIVYDRYHMQAQFGKEVLGVVRLKAAREHRDIAKNLRANIKNTDNATEKQELKKQAKSESKLYRKLKNSRWSILMNSSKLSDEKSNSLQEILNDHNDLAVCYAMKEELCELYALTDEVIARKRWIKWFKAAKASGIDALFDFAERKEERIEGLIAHATHNISTGKLEGLNNKIKVSKRISYGFRDETYFFTLIRYLSIPWIKYHH